MYREINKCRICGNKNLVTILNLGVQALTGVFPLPDEEIPSAPLELVKCCGKDYCGLVQLRHECDPNLMYGDNYGYRSGLNKSMIQHLAWLSRVCMDSVSLQQGDLIVDIGSNDCTFLKNFGGEYDLVGIDPTVNKFKEYYPPEVKLVAEFFSDSCVKDHTDKKAKLITSFAMLYDLSDPLSFFKQIHSVLSDDGVWVSEQAYLGSLIDSLAFDSICCHEHLEGYAVSQIEWLLEKSNLYLYDLIETDTNGGSFIFCAGKDKNKQVKNFHFKDKELEYCFDDLFVYKEVEMGIEINKRRTLAFLKQAKAEGKLVIGLGASTKGNVLLQYYGITPDLLPYIAEINQYKYGRVTPGTNIPIISEEESKKLNPDYYLVLPWHFRSSLIKTFKAKGFFERGGKMVFPLPNMEINSGNIEVKNEGS